MNVTEWIQTGVQSGRDRDVITQYLAGNTGADIGRAYNLSREYVRQILNRILRYKPVLEEDISDLKYWFEKYGFLKCEQFVAAFKIPVQTYYYWKLTTKRDTTTKLSDLLNDPNLSEEFRNNVIEQFPSSVVYKETNWHKQAMERYKKIFDNNPYAQLTVIDIVREVATEPNRKYKLKLLCKCSCGNTTTVAINNINNTKSCGCRMQKHSWITRTCQVINLTTGKVYESLKSAGEDTNLDRNYLWFACNGKIKSAGGYQWAYTGKTSARRVRCIETGEIFESAGKAGKGVWQVLNGRCKTANGYHWEYVD